jgi:nitrite reductase/ring-hydroxylating ferredoxin subunit/multimeric flavodoxin WrbA
MPESNWVDVGEVEALQSQYVQEVTCGKTSIALSYKDGTFSAISGVCNHVGGPLGDGRLDGDYVVCPWHYWKFHRQTGQGEPGYEQDQVPAYATRVENGRLYVDLSSATKRKEQPHKPHPLARPVVRQAGPVRVVGIATTAMTSDHPRYSTSDALLEVALEHARAALGLETQYIKLRELSFRPCEGFYSKAAQACTWPCSITQMDPTDQLDRVYEALVHWADVILISTPIRWGNASSLYFKMVERLNCIQNQETIANRHLLKNKVAAFIIMGGQDNVQGVAGQLMTFFAEVGCQFPQFPFIAHSRGWSAEDMERNVSEVRNSQELREGARALVTRAADMARLMVAGQVPDHPLAPGGRKAHQLDSEPTG